jgi:hypothetical protein
MQENYALQMIYWKISSNYAWQMIYWKTAANNNIQLPSIQQNK